MSDITKMYVAEKKVKEVITVDRKTPGGGEMVEVRYLDNSFDLMPKGRFEAVRTFKEGDATKMRDKLVNHLSLEIVKILYEYGLHLDEIDPVVNGAVNMINSNVERASNLMWGVAHGGDRDLLAVNDILMKSFKATPMPNLDNNDPTKPADNGASPEGSGADKPNQE